MGRKKSRRRREAGEKHERRKEEGERDIRGRLRDQMRGLMSILSNGPYKGP